MSVIRFIPASLLPLYINQTKIKELEFKKEGKKLEYLDTYKFKTAYEIQCLNKQIRALKMKSKKKGKSKLRFEIIVNNSK